VNSRWEILPAAPLTPSTEVGVEGAYAGMTSVMACISSGPTIHMSAAQTNNAVADRCRNGIASTRKTA